MASAKGVGRLDLIKGDIGLDFLLKALGIFFIKGVTWSEGLTGSGITNLTDSTAHTLSKGPLGVSFSDCGCHHVAIVLGLAHLSTTAVGAAGCKSTSDMRISDVVQSLPATETDNVPECEAPETMHTVGLPRPMSNEVNVRRTTVGRRADASTVVSSYNDCAMGQARDARLRRRLKEVGEAFVTNGTYVSAPGTPRATMRRTSCPPLGTLAWLLAICTPLTAVPHTLPSAR